MKLLVHRYIRKRMSPHRAKVAEGEHLEWHLYELREAFRDLWHGMAEPQARLPPPPLAGEPPADQERPPHRNLLYRHLLAWMNTSRAPCVGRARPCMQLTTQPSWNAYLRSGSSTRGMSNWPSLEDTAGKVRPAEAGR